MNHALALAGLAIILTACSSAEPAAGPSSAAAPSSTTSPTPVPSSAPESTSAVDGTSATLKDDKGDAEDGDLTRVKLSRDGEDLVVQWRLADDVPTNGEFSLFLMVSSNDGEESRQLSLKWLDGELIGNNLFDMGTAENTNLDEKPLVEGGTVTGTFPWEESVGAFGDTWKWQASTAVDGQDTDFSPDEEGGATLTQADFPG